MNDLEARIEFLENFVILGFKILEDKGVISKQDLVDALKDVKLENPNADAVTRILEISERVSLGIN